MDADTPTPILAGRQLRQAREKRSLSLEQVAQATRIRVHYLQALENGEYDELPSLAQARGFTRAYAGYLNLDSEALLKGERSPGIAKPAAALSASQPETTLLPQPFDAPPAKAQTGSEGGQRPPGRQRPPEQQPQPKHRTSSAVPAPAPDSAAPKDIVSSQTQDQAPAAIDSPIPTAQATPESSPALEAAQATVPAVDASKVIFIEIGARLKRQRELLGLSLDDVERHTHLRQHYLKFLEAGDMHGLPSPVQGRGMLNNYAAFLGLDPEPLLLRFADALQTRLAAQQKAQPKSNSTTASQKSGRNGGRHSALPAPLRRIFSGDVLLGVILAMALIGFIAWGAIRVFALQSNLALESTSVPTATAPSIADVLLASPTPTASQTPAPATPTSALPPALQPQATDALTGNPLPVESQGKVQIYVSVRQRTWMRVIVDGETEFEGRVLPGSAYTFVGNTQVEILTGNGAGLQIYYGQSDLGVMGAFGEIVNRIYTLQDVLEPTPTITPTSPPTQPGGADNQITDTPAVVQPTPTSAPSLP